MTLAEYIYVDDCGTVVNPLIVEGQIHGGLAHLGVTHVDIPIKSEQVWRILREKGVAT